jgi:hypothetical protein
LATAGSRPTVAAPLAGVHASRMPAPRSQPFHGVRSSSAIALLGALASGCVPSHWVYLRVPVAGPVGNAVVDVPLARLRAFDERFSTDGLAFYDTGRDARPYRLVDLDEDGRYDHARVAIRIGEERAPTTLTVLGTHTDRVGIRTLSPPLAGDPEPTSGVALDFDRATLRR